MAKKFLLRIEGVNFGSFVLDNTDLSTVRGGSLLLLDAAKWAGSQIGGNAATISQGASTGLYRIEANNHQEACEIARKLSRQLDEHPLYRHATFVVSQAEIAGDRGADYATACESATAIARWRQMQQPTVMARSAAQDWHQSIGDSGDKAMKPLDENEAKKRDEKANEGREAKRIACGIDHLRPATQWIEGAGTRVKHVSPSTAVRNANGRHQKRRFYESQFGELNIPAKTPERFAVEFEQIATVPNNLDSSHGDIARLHGKFAVIYLDGNRFGQKMRTHCTDPSKHRAWDKSLRQSRGQFIAELFDTIDGLDQTAQSLWYVQDNKSRRLQLETLLWGGDEIIWVVPAWQGWQLLCRFFQKWQFPPADSTEFLRSIGPLSHAAGIVFCHHKAPIHRTTDLVKSLGEMAKSVSRDHNLVGYEVLESFDHTGDDLSAYRQSRALLCPPPQPQSGNAAGQANAQAISDPMEQQRREQRRHGQGRVQSLEERRRQRAQERAAQQSPQPQEQPAPENKTRDKDRLILNLAQMQAVDELCFQLKSSPDFPRGKMRAVVLRAFETDAQYEPLEKEAGRILNQISDEEQKRVVQRSLKAFDGDSLRMLHHACELWDYIGLSHQWS